MKNNREKSSRSIAGLCCIAALVVFLASALSLPALADDGEDGLRTVRVGYYTLDNFQEYDASTGQYRGYSYEYMMAVAQYAGWTFEFVPVTYSDGLRMLEAGELDLMNAVSRTDELSRSLSFSALPSGESCTCLVVSQDNTDVAFEDFASFEGLTVGLDYASSLNSGFVDYCKDNDCMPRLIYYHTAEGVAKGMADGEIDAYLLSNLDDAQARTVAKFDTQSYYFATTKGDTDLLTELNAAMNALKTSDPYFEEKIYAKYHGSSSEQQTVISDDEKAYIESSPVVKVSYDPDWYPLSYTGDDGQFSGAMASLFQLISDRTGLRFEYVAAGSGAEALSAFRDGQTQVMAGFAYDYPWAAQNNARVTVPFTTMTVFAAYRAARDQDGRVAVGEDSYLRYLSGRILRGDYEFLDCASPEECLRAVLTGAADYAFLDSYQVEYYREKADYRNLSFKVADGEDYGLSIAVSSAADERLYTIISKTLSSVGSDEVSSIFKQTALSDSSLSLRDALYANPKTAGVLFALLGFLAAVLIVGGLYARSIGEKNRQLEAATNAKSEFLSNISHDMRTPLNGIIGYTSLALTSSEPDQTRDYLGKIRISGQFLLSLINDTLDISKIESGKFLLDPQPVDARELLESITVPIRQTAEEKGVRFLLDTSRMTSGAVRVDRLGVQKIILNLLSNAVKFTPAGGTVALSIVDLSPAKDGVTTRLTVRDNGIGISPEFLPKLFEPFTQEHAPEARDTVGTGLGLSIVKKLVTLMGGRIEVQSEKGSGSRFDVYLPIEHLPDYSPDKPDVVAPETALRGRRALLCEDNAMNREIATAVLTGFGMEIVSAADGQEGLALFSASKEGEFDVILMDLRMPVLNGYQAAAAIRRLERADAASVPIIAMSADAYEDDIQKCREAGMNAHIPKPIDNELLFRELVKVCGEGKGETT